RELVDLRRELQQRRLLERPEARRHDPDRALRDRRGPPRRRVQGDRALSLRSGAVDLGVPPALHRGHATVRARLPAASGLAARLHRRVGAAMIRFLLGRFVWSLVVIWFVVSATFVMVSAVPADPIRTMDQITTSD